MPPYICVTSLMFSVTKNQWSSNGNFIIQPLVLTTRRQPVREASPEYCNWGNFHQTNGIHDLNHLHKISSIRQVNTWFMIPRFEAQCVEDSSCVRSWTVVCNLFLILNSWSWLSNNLIDQHKNLFNFSPSSGQQFTQPKTILYTREGGTKQLLDTKYNQVFFAAIASNKMKVFALQAR